MSNEMSNERVNSHTIDSRYISDGINEDYKSWEKGESGKQPYRVFIESPTGSGKTFFILNKLLPYAIKKDRSIIYICNRDAVKQQIIQAIRESPFTLQESDYNEKQFSNFKFPGSVSSIFIVNYQSLVNFVSDPNHPIHKVFLPYYLVMDEVHFFLEDALYNQYSDVIFWNILRFYYNTVQLFLSATMLDFWNLYTLTYEMFLPPHPLNTIYYNNFYEFRTEYYINQYAAPRYNVILYNDDDFLYKRIAQSNDEKWLIFTTKIEKGRELKKDISKYKKCHFINADSKNTKRWENLIATRRFDCDVLISTKVLDNGVNIVDDKLQNIVLPFMYPTDFLQMIGRKRFTETSTCVNIYVRRLSSPEIRSKINNLNSKLDEFYDIATAASMREKIHVIKNYWNGKNNSGFDFKYSRNDLQITFNRLALYKLSLELEFYSHLVLEYNNPAVYFKLINLWLGKNIIGFENISQKTDLLTFLESQVDSLITDTEKFYTDFKELYLMYCITFFRDNNLDLAQYEELIKFRQATGRHKATINECLEKLNLPYVIKKKNNGWIVTPIAAEKQKSPTI